MQESSFSVLDILILTFSGLKRIRCLAGRFYVQFNRD